MGESDRAAARRRSTESGWVRGLRAAGVRHCVAGAGGFAGPPDPDGCGACGQRPPASGQRACGTAARGQGGSPVRGFGIAGSGGRAVGGRPRRPGAQAEAPRRGGRVGMTTH